MVPACNWCGGDELHDANGCLTGFVCENGVDPCAVSECPGSHDCAESQTCMRDGLCGRRWPRASGHAAFRPEPCTTDPCLPGMVAVVTRTTDPALEYVLVVNGGWVGEEYDWEAEWGYAFGEGSTVLPPAGSSITPTSTAGSTWSSSFTTSPPRIL
jgi:hypothetical protein